MTVASVLTTQACSADDIRWLMEWAVFLLIALAFGIAGAYRWAISSSGDRNDPR